jgi:hypothetical protein
MFLIPFVFLFVCFYLWPVFNETKDPWFDSLILQFLHLLPKDLYIVWYLSRSSSSQSPNSSSTLKLGHFPARWAKSSGTYNNVFIYHLQCFCNVFIYQAACAQV